MLKCDGVFEGGGVKGIGLVGGVTATQEAGYEYQNLVGTSAGAIVASLLAVGYTGLELKEILIKLNYNDFKDESFLSKWGPLGKMAAAVFDYGIFKGDAFENWLQNLLMAKNKTVFRDLIIDGYTEDKYKYRFQAIACDISSKRLLVLPQDISYYGYDPDEMSIAKAVRMSMSLPIFFKPVKLVAQDKTIHYIVDGGVLSNYPIWLLDDGTSDPEWPTFGYKLVEGKKEGLPEGDYASVDNLWEYAFSLVKTLIEGHDNYHISESKGDFARSICISNLINVDRKETMISTTDFDITSKESVALFENGLDSARSFFKDWDFELWKQLYRSNLKKKETVKALV